MPRYHTAEVQDKVLAFVASSQFHGRTIAEARDNFPDEHHGTLSGTLSALHKDGRVARLSAKRGRCKIYVMPWFDGGRQTEPQGWGK